MRSIDTCADDRLVVSAERRQRAEEEAKAAKLAKAAEEEARRQLATVRREEALEVRSEGTRLEREMKADRVAKAERVFKYQHECDVAEMEAKHREYRIVCHLASLPH
eukprot:COSAG04_NODE_224_length_19624_cov_47.932855_3_plen_107_part_00